MATVLITTCFFCSSFFFAVCRACWPLPSPFFFTCCFFAFAFSFAWFLACCALPSTFFFASCLLLSAACPHPAADARSTSMATTPTKARPFLISRIVLSFVFGCLCPRCAPRSVRDQTRLDVPYSHTGLAGGNATVAYSPKCVE